jgi:RNA recognition motif-containing protein
LIICQQLNISIIHGSFIAETEVKRLCSAAETYALHNGRPILNQPTRPISAKVQSSPSQRSSIFVGNLSQEVTEQRLKDLFSQYGVVKRIKLHRGNKGGGRNSASIQIEAEFNIEAAIKNLDKTKFMGKTLVVRKN